MLINYGSCVILLNQTDVVKYTLIVNTVPSDADLDLIAAGYEPVGNTITVRNGTVVRCEAYKTGYVPYVTEVTVTQDETRTIQLETGVLCTINPTPSDASVIFVIDGYEHGDGVTKALEVPIGRQFGYIVSKEGYETFRGTATITEPTTINVQLEPLSPFDLEDYNYEQDEEMNAILTEYIGSNPNPEVP